MTEVTGASFVPLFELSPHSRFKTFQDLGNLWRDEIVFLYVNEMADGWWGKGGELTTHKTWTRLED